MVAMRAAGMPKSTIKALADLARASPRARLYSFVPRSSQWPSMVTLTFELAFRNAAFLRSTSWACVVRDELS